MNAQPTRDPRTSGQPLDWPRSTHAFRHFDRSPCNWREARPGWEKPRSVTRRALRRARLRAGLRRLGQWALDFIHPDPRERRKIYIYLVATSWLVMLTMGLLAAHGILPR